MNPPDIAIPLTAEDLPLVEAFLRQATFSPDRTAVICGPKTVTYRELDQLSNRIANALFHQGVSKNDFVGIGLPRSIELIAALFAVLKTGAAYIPIDPAYPAARIGHMVKSSGLRTIVSTSPLASAFSDTALVEVDRLPEEALPIAPSDFSSDDLIYAIFTSGSTGQAKAATVRHRGFRNLLKWYTRELSLGLADTTLVISSPSFDLTQKNFYAPLITGGTLVLDDGDNYDIHRISGLIRDHKVTLVNCTPSAFYPLVDAAGENFAALSSLRFAVLGGEAISITRLRAWLSHPENKAEVVNSYGPTECTDICAFHRLHSGNLDDHSFVPTGREIPEVTVTIRDENLTILPAGEVGELCIEGIGVGGGYLNDPARTAERFVSGVYRTGDLARKDQSGLIEFRGRADHQVKVNGFRIELGEIESALTLHPSVRDAIVTAKEGRLTAHVIPEIDANELRNHLAITLPVYMIPGRFLFPDAFPLTPNGKVDRKAIESSVEATNDTELTSDDSLQTRILKLWSEVLERNVSDPSANFFDIGGTSIHLAIVHVRLREMTGSDLPITDLFAHPSARSLAAHLSPAETSTNTAAQNRARLQQAGFSNFRRPTRR